MSDIKSLLFVVVVGGLAAAVLVYTTPGTYILNELGFAFHCVGRFCN